MRAGIEAHYVDNFDAGEGAFFVATKGETTRQVATNLGLGDENTLGVTAGIVIPVTSFWGRHSSELWDWISVKKNANGD